MNRNKTVSKGKEAYISSLPQSARSTAPVETSKIAMETSFCVKRVPQLFGMRRLNGKREKR